MRNPSILKDYLVSVDLPRLLEELDVSDAKRLLQTVEHFTEKEANKRDQIVLSYFGERGVNLITESILNRLLAEPELRSDARILDIGAGSGFFTLRVARRLRPHVPKASFYAMDITPAMLMVLAKKDNYITPFLGLTEHMTQSVKQARKYVQIPEKFDAMLSTLALHHCLNVESAFEGMRDLLDDHGKVVIVDLCTHPFEEFKAEMSDIHLGFEPSWIREIGAKFFPRITVEKMPGICCKSSGRSADLFISLMTKMQT